MSLLLGSPVSCLQAAEPSRSRTARESVLGRTEPEGERGIIVYSEDARHVAYTGKADGRTRVYHDGVMVPSSGEVRRIVLSPNGRRLAFSVATSRGEKLVLDGRESEEFNQVAGNSFAFSSDSRRFGYLAFRNQDLVAVIEELNPTAQREPGPSPGRRLTSDSSDPSLLQMSADGQHLAHAGKTNSYYCVVHDGRAGFLFRNGVGALTLSPDGRRLAYIGVNGNTRTLVLDGTVMAEDTSDENFNALAFSPDSRRFAYSRRREGRSTFWIDGQESEAFSAFGKASIRFSPDSRRVAYAVVNQGEWLVVTNGRKSRVAYDSVGTRYSPIFSPDSKRVAYFAKRHGEWFVVLDDREQTDHYLSVGAMAFSPDSQRLAYQVRQQNGWELVIDAKPADQVYVSVSHPVFDTPTRLHFIGERHVEANKHELVLVDVEMARP